MRRLFIFLVLIISLSFLPISVDAYTLPSSYVSYDNTIIIQQNKSYKLKIPKKYKNCKLKVHFDYGRKIVKVSPSYKVTALKTGSAYITLSYKNWSKDYIIKVIKHGVSTTDDFFSYPYLQINGRLSCEEKYLLCYGYDSLEPRIKQSMLDNKVKIVISDSYFKTKHWLEKGVVGVCWNNSSYHEIFLDNSYYGADALVHEVGHFWSYITNHSVITSKITGLYNKDPMSYGNYNHASIEEFYASYFKVKHMKKCIISSHNY